MTCRLVTPWWLERAPAARPTAGSVTATPLLDWRSPEVQELVHDLTRGDSAGMLRQAHGLIARRVRPVYAVNDLQAASRTLERGRGSCSQRLGVLEAVARALAVPTRARGLLVDGKFWYPRFPRLRFAVPDAVLLAWPEFLLDGAWVSASELFGSLEERSGLGGFSNTGGETLFGAVARTAVDWDGVTSTPGTCSACDLSATVLRDLGRFDSRDELFAEHGQTLCWGVRTVVAPVASRWSAGASA